MFVGVLTGYTAFDFNPAQRFLAAVINFFAALLLLGATATSPGRKLYLRFTAESGYSGGV